MSNQIIKMSTRLVELRPEKHLLNPNFNGYKLSLEKIPILKEKLKDLVYNIVPNADQYSLLHTRLFGLHNHLFTDYYNNREVYFIDKLFNVKKVCVNEVNGQITEIKTVWSIPDIDPHNSDRYNISLQFISPELAVLSDGGNKLYVLNTEDRPESDYWHSIVAEKVLDQTSFIIQDAILKTIDKNTQKRQIQCLLLNIIRSDNDKFSTVINWITLQENNDFTWSLTTIKTLKSESSLYYCVLEPNCEYIYIASDKPFKFILDSDFPITDNSLEIKSEKKYTWSQNTDDITIKLSIETNWDKNDLTINTQPNYLEVKYKNETLLEGTLCYRINPELTTWTISDKFLEITLIKSETGQKWLNLISNNTSGEQIFDSNEVDEIHQKLAHLCSESEIVNVESVPTFNAQQIEDCDFDGESTAIFERISGTTHDVTHRINLGSYQVLMTVKLFANEPPSFAIRNDVDTCLWTPQLENNDNWSVKHAGTLLAFGYVQASKQQRKFLSCAPDLSYSVICEASRHIFVYRQHMTVSSGELRNRRNGSRVENVAQQQVVNLTNDHILGMSATNEFLYLLTENDLFLLKMQCNVEI